MKKLILSLAVIAVAASAIVAVNATKDFSALIDANVDALAHYEGVTGIGRICVYEPNIWCIYLYPYEEYEGKFISDVVRN